MLDGCSGFGFTVAGHGSARARCGFAGCGTARRGSAVRAHGTLAVAISQLMVEMTFLDSGGPLLVHLRLGAVALGLGLRDARLLLGLVRPLATDIGLFAGLSGHLAAAVTHLNLAPLTQGSGHRQSDEHDHYDDDDD